MHIQIEYLMGRYRAEQNYGPLTASSQDMRRILS